MDRCEPAAQRMYRASTKPASSIVLLSPSRDIQVRMDSEV
jgi:hypothetical protein